MRILHSVSVQERAQAADAIVEHDLAVNPLSVVLLCLRPLNATGTLSDFASYLNICSALNRITISLRGSAVMSMSGADAAALAYFRHGIIPPQANHDDADDERRCVVLPILMGRFPYDPVSCFPASRRGELVLELDFDVADTGYDGMRYSVETVELLGVNPKEFERKVDMSQTFAATGNNDVELPIGNVVRGVLLFGTTGFGGATPAPSWGRVELRLDNQEVGYSSTDFEVAHALSALWGRQPPAMDGHTHRVDATGGATEETAGGPINVGVGFEQYAWLDLDPLRDDSYSVDTSSGRRFFLRADAETADAVRAIAVERVGV